MSPAAASWTQQIPGVDEHLDPDGRVMDSMLSEHFCEGFLEGYLLTGRHGFFDSYEAFIRIVDSMFSQHAKWLKMCNELPWRQDIASLNYILASNVWQQDHNGFTHQDPGFLDHVANKKADVVRMYLPPDANCLLSCFDHCIKSRNYVNVIVASKHPRPQWLTMDQAVKHCTQGIGIWDWASNDQGQEPDVVMACCGDTPTLETLAAVTILRHELPELKIRVVNVVDLMKLQPHTEHPHGLTDEEYDMLFTKDKPIIFAYHGYPTLIHELTYRRPQQEPPCPGLQGGGHHHHALRHAGPQRHRPLRSGDRRRPPPASAGQPGRLPGPEDERQAGGAPPVYHGQRRGPARGPELEVERRQGQLLSRISTKDPEKQRKGALPGGERSPFALTARPALCYPEGRIFLPGKRGERPGLCRGKGGFS